MIKKVRVKFIVLSMIATLVVTVALVLAINLVNMVQTDANQDSVLQELSEVERELSEFLEDPELNGDSSGMPPAPEDSSGEASLDLSQIAASEAETDDDEEREDAEDEEEETEDEELEDVWESSEPEEELRDTQSGQKNEGESKGVPAEFEGENWKKDDKRFSVENQYSGRYFIVTMTTDGTVEVGTHSQEIPPDQALSLMIESIAERGNASGYVNDYRYLYWTDEDGTIHVCFLDSTTELDAQQRLVWVSVIVGAVGLIISFLFIFFMSGKIVLPLKTSMEKQKRFITDAGHELKTPLAVIGTNMDILSMDLGENEWVDGTKKQITKLRKLVNHLISLSKMDEGTTPLIHEHFDLSAAASESADPFSAAAEMDGKELVQEITEGLATVGDEMQTRQLFTILVDNAVKYSVGDGPIYVRLKKEGKKAVFETANDWDRSHAPDDLNKLFDRFYRTDVSRDRSSGKSGYGLGLSIAQSIAEREKISISVSEDQEKRLVFRVVFKLES